MRACVALTVLFRLIFLFVFGLVLNGYSFAQTLLLYSI